jgi:CRISPR/Cas system-associated exonuclease Cas4 (RecB family)
LWIEILQEKIYVKRRDEPGINLYPYRVSAGIKPAVHFVIGLSHDSSNIVSKTFGFMTEQQRKGIDAGEQNMSDDFLNIYSESGERVWFSCSTETPGGVSVPPAVFLEDDAVERVNLTEKKAGTPFVNENLWWAGGLESPTPALTPFQKKGFEYARKTFMLPVEFDAAETPFPQGEIRDMLTEQLTDEAGLLRTSASALNNWQYCPFKFLFSMVLDVNADEYVLKPEDNMTAGLILHEILHDFFSILKGQNKSFSGAETEAYREIIKRVSEEVFDRWEKSKNRFFGPAWDALKRRAFLELSRYPEAEAEYYEGMKPVYLEKWFDFVLEEEKIRVGGFIDRISESSEGAVIVDYKKRWQKKPKAEFIQYDENGSLQTPEAGFQLPFYILLASEAGMNIIGSSYYGIAEAQHYPVTGNNGVINEKETEDLCSLTSAAIREMAESVRGGEYQATETCDGCDYRAVCRKKFIIRWHG